ncbi:hypothetical protein MLD38_007333 [Melastoma candidum]|uniref:Uncharacterized protein n=1 Tax=Melastoma candidum TaxID=119954 RepID=A0ACB9RQ13_9MYRT|nr:hypothetical protein MLD38_007333 [Melastoma candidum]
MEPSEGKFNIEYIYVLSACMVRAHVDLPRVGNLCEELNKLWSRQYNLNRGVVRLRRTATCLGSCHVLELLVMNRADCGASVPSISCIRGTKALGQAGKQGGGNGWALTSKSRLTSPRFSVSPAYLIAGFCFFSFVGFFPASSLLSQDIGSGVRFKGGLDLRRQLEAEERAYEPLPHGDTGDDSFTAIPSQVLSWKPRALYFPNFATKKKQCESIIKIAKSGLKPSMLALRKGETTESTQGIRTSSGMFTSASEDKTGVLAFIEEKIARATSLPRSHGEAFNVLRYEVGQRYNSHYDAFSPSEYGLQKSQRVASFLLYLSDVEKGGETMFPFETSLHGSCPVIRGQKWVATKWIRDQVQDD